MTTTTAKTLAELLAAAEVALERGHGPEAARAITTASSTCAELASLRVIIDPLLLAKLATQHARLEARAGELRDVLAGKLKDLARSRRAVAAYRRR